MKKTNVFIKVVLVLGILLALLGGVIFTVAMTISGWDFNVLATNVLEKRVFEITEQEEISNISSIKIDHSTLDVNVVCYDGQKIIIEGFDLINRKGEVIEKLTTNVVNGELAIGVKKEKFLIFSVGTIGKNTLTVKIPKNKVVNLSVAISTGDIIVGGGGESCNFNNLSLSTTTGDVFIKKSTTCNDIIINNSTGDAYIKASVKAKAFTRKATTGKLFVDGKIEAEKITVKQSTGDVICSSYITAKEIKVKTTTGDVTLKLLGSKADYKYSYDVSTGESNILPMENAGATKDVFVTVSTGDIFVYFER